MGGLVVSRLRESPWAAGWLLVAAAIATFAAVLNRRSALGLVALAYCFFLGGVIFQHLRTARLGEWARLPPREAKLVLQIERLFGSGSRPGQTLGLGTILTLEGAPELQGQRVCFSLRQNPKYPPPIPSTRMLVRGVIAPIPRNADTNTFDGYLLNSGVNLRFKPGKILRSVAPPTAYRRFCHRAQVRFGRVLTQGLERHPELAAIIRGMLLGEVVDLSATQKQLFIQSGTLHLFSISGLHIAAIAVALHVLLGLLRLPRFLRFASSAVILWLYVDITGSSPSAVRAVVMVILVEAAFVLRCPVNPVATLCFAAFASLLGNPMQLFSASFQMSYGIVASLLLLGLPFGEWLQLHTAPFRNLPKVTWTWRHHLLSHAQRWLCSGLGIGSATSLVSAICGVLYFNLFTPGALLANLLLIPISSFTLWAGFLSLLFGLPGLKSVSVLFNHSAAFSLFLMEKGMQLLLALPGMFWAARFERSATGFASLAVLICLLLHGYATRWEWRFGGWLPPFLLTGLVLLFAVRFG
jgi:competence protein ComEC